jgi:pyrimidine operon attenuation protein / uracil phosphoribosyltransferase
MDNIKTLILSAKQVDQKIQRIAHQILEKNYDEKEIVLIGIANRGYLLAEKIYTTLQSITEIKVTLHKLKLHKDKPLENDVDFSTDLEYLNNKSIILIDDVLNSGRTLIYATRYILDSDLKHLTTVALVDRKHRKFPIKANFVGLTLSTTLQEHISVDFKEDGMEVFLD